MKGKWIVLAAVILGISLSAPGTAAQGPQGVGAGEAARSDVHSYNPMKWMKKKPPTATEALDADSTLSGKLTSRLQRQGALPAKANLKETCSTFQDLAGCIAALHAGHNLGLEFDCLKSMLTGVQTSVYMSSCTKVTDGKPMSLNKAIHALKPDADAKAAAKNAEEQARDDLKDAGFAS
jgi:hypothetical protein